MENTLEAFESARLLGADMVEMDCKLTRDGHVVVLHDHDLNRLWGVAKPINSLDWAEVRAIRARGYRVPDLAETLATVPLPVMVDVPTVAVAEASLAVAEASGALGRCMFAGHTGALVRLRQLSRTVRIALSWERRRLPPPELLAEVEPEWFNPHWPLATGQIVAQMHDAGLGVSVWTVDQARHIRKALRAGADAVITNDTARVVAALAHP